MNHVETEIQDDAIAERLTNLGYKFRFCKRIISRNTNKATLMIRVITGDVETFEKMLSVGNIFFKNRCYPITPSLPPKPIPQPCGKCSSFDHITDDCKAQKKCTKCLGNHDTFKCDSPLPPKCSACNAEDHAAWSTKCPKRPLAPVEGIPNVKIRPVNKKTADLPPSTTNGSRIHQPII